MRCSAVSADFVRFMRENKKPYPITEPDTVLLPFYGLPGYQTICNNWTIISPNSISANPVSYAIDLNQLDTPPTWASLGHPTLDAVPSALTPAQAALLAEIEATITFHEPPRAFDVQRGLWDSPMFRAYAACLSPRAPPVVGEPFCKTTRFLLTKGFDITLRLPRSVATPDAAAAAPRRVSLAFLNIPLAEVSLDRSVLKFRTESSNYPYLVAALAELV
jgi:hypothetical protein